MGMRGCLTVFKSVKSIISTIVLVAFLFALWKYFQGDLGAIIDCIVNLVSTVFFKVANFFTDVVFPAIGLK